MTTKDSTSNKVEPVKKPSKIKVSEAKFNALVDEQKKVINDTKKQCGIKMTLQERKASDDHAVQIVSKSHYFGHVGNFNHFHKDDQKLIVEIDDFIKAQKKKSKTGLKAICPKGIEYGFGRYINKTGKVVKPKKTKKSEIEKSNKK